MHVSPRLPVVPRRRLACTGGVRLLAAMAEDLGRLRGEVACLCRSAQAAMEEVVGRIDGGRILSVYCSLRRRVR